MMLVSQVTGHNIRHHCCYHPAITASSVPRSYRDSAAPHRTRICVGAYGGLCVLLDVATVISAIYVEFSAPGVGPTGPDVSVTQADIGACETHTRLTLTSPMSSGNVPV